MEGAATVEEAVQQKWAAQPGVGIQELMAHIGVEFPRLLEKHGTAAVKKRVKAAKIALPYSRANDQPPGAQPGFAKGDMVRTLLEQRQSHRAVRQWERADKILKGLEGMGIAVDDTLKTWTLGPLPQSALDEGTEEEELTDGVPCAMCGRCFGSRNLVFKHLRDPVNGCGLNVAAVGGLAAAPSVTQKQEKRRKAQQTNRSRTHATAVHAAAESCLWVGDLPLAWTVPKGRYKRLQALLSAHLAREVPRPWIKSVTRKAYRRPMVRLHPYCECCARARMIC